MLFYGDFSVETLYYNRMTNNQKPNKKPAKKNQSQKFNKLKEKPVLTYADIEEMVEYLVVTNQFKYRFDGFTDSDIAQEIRQKCFLLLEKWNNNRPEGNPIWFFGKSIQNHLKNLKRNHNLKNPNHNPKDKFNTRPLLSLDYKKLKHNQSTENNMDWEMMSEEVRSRLTTTQRRYYDNMIKNWSTARIPTLIKKKISDVMENIMGEDILGDLPKHNTQFTDRNRNVGYFNDSQIENLNLIPSGFSVY